MNIRRTVIASVFWALISTAWGGTIPELKTEEHSKETILLIRGDTLLQPTIRFLNGEDCWQLDFPGMEAPFSPEPRSFSRGPLRAFLWETVCFQPPIQRLSCYMKPGAQMKFQAQPQGCRVQFLETSSRDYVLAGGTGKPRPLALLSPQKESEDVVLDLHQAPALPVFLELAERAKLALHFRDPLPTRVSFRVHCSEPRQALEQLVRHCGMRLTSEDGTWWVTHHQNPLLKIPMEGQVDPEFLRNLTLRQAVQRVAGSHVGTMLLKRLPRSLQEKRLPEPFELKACPRRWVEEVLSAHGVSTSKKCENEG